ncbi:MAG: ABC transporter ATP-binding protein, partial [Actinobacteria bacterium]|nr:ABC transporter ATP-binding protein [Actinomycetota bacterium]
MSAGDRTPVLEVDELTVRFPGSQPSARAVSFSLAQGDLLGVVGESGSGKSVTMMALLGLLPRNAIVTGSVRFGGHELLEPTGRRLRAVRGRNIAIVFQDPLSALNPGFTIGSQIGETLRLRRQRLSRAERRARAIEVLRDVGLPDGANLLRRFPHELSGGMRQRVLLAVALAGDPQVLLADEPTTALDVTVQAQILRLLAEIRTRMGMGILFITHDLGIVRKFADRTCVMTGGHIVEAGPTAEIFAAPRHDYTKKLLAAEPKGAPPSADDAAEVVAQADDVRVWFPIRRGFLRRVVDHVKAVDGVSLTLRAGQTIGIVGESGSGKTTLGLAMLRLVPSTGRIVVLGRDVQGLDAKAMRPLRREAQVVFQDPFGSLSPRLSVAEIVAEGLAVHLPNLSDEEREAKVIRVLEEVGLDPETRHRYPHEFSGGQRQRISIARAM